MIATDNDAPGDALAEELARRLGRERCWRVRWPLDREDHAYARGLAGLPALEGGEEEAAAAAGAEGEPVAEAADAAGDAAGDAPSAAEAAPADDSAAEPAPEAAAVAAAAAADEATAAAAAAEAEATPKLDTAWYRKDANEVLLKDGPEVTRAFVDNAEPFPIRGLLR